MFSSPLWLVIIKPKIKPMSTDYHGELYSGICRYENFISYRIFHCKLKFMETYHSDGENFLVFIQFQKELVLKNKNRE